ncbi:MAG: type I DNA topoisomerase [Dehalococcoidales bacterium]|nr:type I DNA topoisomerase [Dehalococcoidales bacterium]
MKKNLVIVESPAKARTLSRILGNDYSLKASLGHVRDLPKSKLGVDIENEFTPTYVVPRAKNKIVQELKEAVKAASTVYLATDPDREGEAISWHLVNVMKSNKTRYQRVVFHEITEEAVKNAFKHPRSIDMQLVNAQQARRVLDRLVGYKISPLLWRKVRRGLSAGRVQSVAVRIVVDREREIEKFVPVEYWSIEAELTRKIPAAKAAVFRALLVSLANGTKLEIHNQKEANTVKGELEDANYSVSKVKTKKVTRQPAPPFITSTLQQEAWRHLRFTAEHTMAIAQQLYEGLPIGEEGSVGLITYMRTDSTRVARSAVVEAREFISQKYGTEFIPPHARSFIRVVKGAQEAHEAIRPTKIWREPSLMKSHLTADQSRLYELIWKRMVASQMSAALFDNTTVDIEARSSISKKSYLFRTSSSVNRFPGFTVLYTEQPDQEAKEEKQSPSLPQLEKGDELNLLGLLPEQHFTQPPPRFTEATLIKMLEQWGIGRPSTYAPILSTIREREYVTRSNGSFKPTELGFLVNDLVVQYFPDIVDIAFTARMEDELDKIASEKKKEWVSVIKDFYIPFEKNLDNATLTMERVKLPDEVTEEICPKCGKQMVIKTGRFGKFLACSGYPECKNTKSFQLKIGVKCPQCGSELIERVNKKKRTFYGCSNYPNCTFAINYKPLTQRCPKCDSLMTLYKEKWAKCTKCKYRGKLKEA